MIEYTVQVTDVSTEWYFNGCLHREDGPAVERITGYEAWYHNGKRHREDGPASAHTDGYKEWWLHGERHRTDGPAIERADGTTAWYLNGVDVTEAEVMSPAKEMTIAELEAVLGHKLKVIK